MPTDVFRPRLPIDPFHDALPAWHADADAAGTEPHTVLVLGPPTHADLAPLALSPHLASSLLVIATHTPPPVPERTLCAVVTLRLPAPLDIHDAGAVRLVGLLDRAQRVAHTWHAAPHAQPRIQQLAELYPGGEFSIAEPPEFALPATSEPAAPGPRPDASETSSLSSTTSSSSSRSSFGAAGKKAAPQYTFSALINFLPPSLPDKALLKHAILVTTLSAPFLAAQPPPPLQTISRRRSRFVSLFSSSSSSPPSHAPSTDSLGLRAPTPTPTAPAHAHLVHVLPYSASHPHPHRSSTAPTPSALNPNRRSVPLPTTTKSKLAQTIEHFLLSFAYPPSASASAPSLALLSVSPSPSPPPPPLPSSTAHRPAPVRSSPLAPSLRSSNRQSLYPPNPHPPTNMNVSPNTPAIPFIVPAGLLGAYPAASGRCIGEMVLCGVLDCVAAGAVVDGGGWPRAWIGGRGDVVVRSVGGGGGEDGELNVHVHSDGDGPEPEEKEEEEEKEKKKGKVKGRRTRRNEAGLPTPPESSSDDDDDDDGVTDASHATTDNDERRTEFSHHTLPAPVHKMGMKMRSTEFLSARARTRMLGEEGWEDGRGKTRSEAHFGVGGGVVRGKGKGKIKIKLGEKVSRFFEFGGRFGIGKRGRGFKDARFGTWDLGYVRGRAYSRLKRELQQLQAPKAD
ncbi:hypothetical protein C0995_007426 [Termitomyces sp. Mi166|nr:hypothetical protein C0995_007426 [Termitomyces sp. Mi166\